MYKINPKNVHTGSNEAGDRLNLVNHSCSSQNHRNLPRLRAAMRCYGISQVADVDHRVVCRQHAAQESDLVSMDILIVYVLRAWRYRCSRFSSCQDARSSVNDNVSVPLVPTICPQYCCFWAKQGMNQPTNLCLCVYTGVRRELAFREQVISELDMVRLMFVVRMSRDFCRDSSFTVNSD